jgi:murein DD-endopeptidase MepM/ murein hydrolase activator NlpD
MLSASAMTPRTTDLEAFVRARRFLRSELAKDVRRGVLLPPDLGTRVDKLVSHLDASVGDLIAANAPGMFRRSAATSLTSIPDAEPMAPAPSMEIAQAEAVLALRTGVGSPGPKDAATLAILRIETLLAAASAKYGIPVSLLRAVVAVESQFRPSAVSTTGAQGLMQLSPAIAKELGVTDPLDPAENIDAGTRYLASLLKRSHHEQLALAAYHARATPDASTGPAPDVPEIRSYVASVLSLRRAYEGVAAGTMVLRAPLVEIKVSSPFGVRNDPFTNELRFHAGVDLAAPSGTPVHAAGSGLVVFAGSHGEDGQHVVVDHGDGVRTHYSNLSKILVAAGQTVHEGDSIALVGSTGRSTGPHLHFAVTNHGEFADPTAVIGIPFGANSTKPSA